MKITCNTVRDLIIMAETDYVYDDSQQIIKEHLETCEKCREFQAGIIDSVKNNASMKPKSLIEKNDKNEAKTKADKIKRKNITIICGVAILVLFLIVLITNIGDTDSKKVKNALKLCNRFFDYYMDGNMDAAEMLDYTEYYNEIQDEYGQIDDGTEPIEVKIGDQVWYALSNEYNKLDLDTSDAESFWLYIINNYIPNILIPEEIFEQYVPNPTVMSDGTLDGNDCYYVNSYDVETSSSTKNVGFARFKTNYGYFYIYGEGEYITLFDLAENENKGTFNHIKLSEVYRYSPDIAMLSYIVPKEMYEDIKKVYDFDSVVFEKTYSDVNKWTTDEFNKFMVDETKEEIKKFFEKGNSIESYAYMNYVEKNADNEPDKKYGYQYYVKIKDSYGEEVTFEVYLNVIDKKLLINTINSLNDYQDTTYFTSINQLNEFKGY